MNFHVVGVHKDEGYPISTDFSLSHPDDCAHLKIIDWFDIFLTELKLSADELSCFSVFNDNGILCAFANSDCVLWYNDNLVLGSEQDGLLYERFRILCIDFENYRIEEE